MASKSPFNEFLEKGLRQAFQESYGWEDIAPIFSSKKKNKKKKKPTLQDTINREVELLRARNVD